MKLFVVALIVSLFSSSSSCLVKLSSKNKCVAYENIIIEARKRTIHIFVIDRDHSLDEIARLGSPLPIRSIAVVANQYLLAFAELGSIRRIYQWNIDNPERPYRLYHKTASL
jgi:hypothetical protein